MLANGVGNLLGYLLIFRKRQEKVFSDHVATLAHTEPTFLCFSASLCIRAYTALYTRQFVE